MGLLRVTRANTSVGVSPETFLVLLPPGTATGRMLAKASDSNTKAPSKELPIEMAPFMFSIAPALRQVKKANNRSCQVLMHCLEKSGDW
jgi:hypothetical protein